MSETKRICLWSGPRNISTALMYSFAQRKDTSVVDEPLYAHYLTSTEAHDYHPGADEVISTQLNDGNRVIREVIMGEYDTPLVFFKNMTHHLVDLKWDFLKETTNIILTRDPRDMLPSYARHIKHPAMQDVGYAKHLELLNYLHGIGQKPPVIDSKEILIRPGNKLAQLCNYLDIPFDESMLNWNPGPRPEDGVWAKHWYQNVHKSSGFEPYTPKKKKIPEHLKKLLNECEKIYNILLDYSL
jgi:hypothetical protein